MDRFTAAGGEHQPLTLDAERRANSLTGPLQLFRRFQAKAVQAGGIGPGHSLSRCHRFSHLGRQRCGGAAI